jgi:TonB family protein
MKPLHRIATFAAAALLSIAAAQAQDATPVVHVDNPPNAQAQQSTHYVILVSLDGFRYDYPTKYGAPHLLSMATNGASAPDGMLPSYPSITFPNHLTLVTGLYPEHHGIVANSFYDPTRDATYNYTQSQTNGDGSWYGGTPLWVLAEQQGMRSACLFWPGSEAAIQGVRPSYYLHFDDKLDDTKRVDQVIAWLNLPPEQRPHFITLYYSNVDHAGHLYGPESEEVRAAVHHIDDMIGDLQTKLAALKLPIDLVVVADHGMVTLKGDPINLGEFANLNGVHTDGSQIYPKDDAEAARIYAEFKTHPNPRFTVYRRADVPAHLHFNENPREGDPVIVPTGPYLFVTHPINPGASHGPLHGMHGFDPSTMPEMKAIFFAQGLDIKPATRLPTFENINVYPFISNLLGLKAPAIDGRLDVLLPALIGSGAMPAKPAARISPKHVGGDVSAPVLLHSQEPEYTEAARKANIRGDVIVSFWVDVDGTPTHIRVIHGLGYGLDLDAINAVSNYRFKPAMENGVPVVVELTAKVNYNIF